MKYNLHTHTRYSDGSSEPERYVEEALNQGFSVLGITDHSPVPFENSFALKEKNLPAYCRAIRELQKKYASPSSAEKTIEILLGLEIDFIPGMTVPFDELRRKYRFDYVIGSVHLVRDGMNDALWFIDGPEISIYDDGMQKIFGGDGRKAVTAYYRQVQEMISSEKPDIVGHLDKVKMYNRGRYFSEADAWYVKLVDETLDLVSGCGAVVEVNTRGMYKKRSDSFFPGPEVLKKILKRNIPITISSDAHKPEELSFLFEECRQQLRSLEFKSQNVLSDGNWKEVAL
ncbi:MAG: histidinol-phosphatase [Bacteroidota bacterium]|jgi:histidinol-phosphatase (PHP family)